MHSKFLLQTIFLTFAFCNSFHSTVTISTTIVVYMPLPNKSSLESIHLTGIANNASATYRYVSNLFYIWVGNKN